MVTTPAIDLAVIPSADTTQAAALRLMMKRQDVESNDEVQQAGEDLTERQTADGAWAQISGAE